MSDVDGAAPAAPPPTPAPGPAGAAGAAGAATPVTPAEPAGPSAPAPPPGAGPTPDAPPPRRARLAGGGRGPVHSSGPAEPGAAPAPGAGDAGPTAGGAGPAGDEAPAASDREAEATPREPEQAWEAVNFVQALEDAISSLLGDVGENARATAATSGGGGVHFHISRVDGDVVGGDKVGHATGRFLGALAIGQVPPEALGDLRASFVPPERFPALRERLEERSVAVLEAPAGWGRTATALHLLADLCGDRVHTLDPDTDLRSLDVGELDEATGYLLDARSGRALARARVTHVERIAAECARRRTHLLVTADAVAGPRDAVRTEFGLSGGARPSADTVLRRHLHARLRVRPDGEVVVDAEVDEVLDAFLARDDVASLLEELADAALGMRRLAGLAGQLARVVDGSRTIDSVRDHLAQQHEHHFEAWFHELCAPGGPTLPLDAAEGRDVDLTQMALVIAIAVFDGMDYFTVARVARDLEERFRQAEGGPDDERRPVFAATRSQRLAAAKAELVPKEEARRFGERTIEAVRFVNPTYARRTIERVWLEHDGARHVVTGWLLDLGRHPEQAVRVRAAAAIGLLATHEFDWVRRCVLLPWADDADRGVRDSAVAGVGAVFAAGQSGAPELARGVVSMVREWARPREPAGRRWVAARAYGAAVGRTMRREALEKLRGLANEDDVALARAVTNSMVELFLPDAAASTEVLGALARWSGARSPVTRQRVALWCFLELAAGVRVEDAGGAVWPAPLWYADRDADTFGQVRRMWRRALLTPFVTKLAWATLGLWVRVVAESADQRMTEALGALMDGLCDGPDGEFLRRRLGDRMREIADDKKAGVARGTARTLLDRLQHDKEQAL